MERIKLFHNNLAALRDYVYPVYFQFMNVVRERKIPVGFIKGVNIENNIRQLFRELVEESK